MEPNWTRAAALGDLGRRTKLRVEVGDTAIALFQVDGRIYAFRDLCVHADRSLTRGTLLHGKVICPGHQWAFELSTGYEEDQDLCQPTYAVSVQDDVIYVDLAQATTSTAEEALS